MPPHGKARKKSRANEVPRRTSLSNSAPRASGGATNGKDASMSAEGRGEVEGAMQDEEEDDNELYEVETVLDHAKSTTGPRLSYLVKWRGYPAEYNLWQPAESLVEAQVVLIAYWATKSAAEIRAAKKFGFVPVDLPSAAHGRRSSVVATRSLNRIDQAGDDEEVDQLISDDEDAAVEPVKAPTESKKRGKHLLAVDQDGNDSEEEEQMEGSRRESKRLKETVVAAVDHESVVNPSPKISAKPPRAAASSHSLSASTSKKEPTRRSSRTSRATSSPSRASSAATEETPRRTLTEIDHDASQENRAQATKTMDVEMAGALADSDEEDDDEILLAKFGSIDDERPQDRLETGSSPSDKGKGKQGRPFSSGAFTRSPAIQAAGAVAREVVGASAGPSSSARSHEEPKDSDEHHRKKPEQGPAPQLQQSQGINEKEKLQDEQQPEEEKEPGPSPHPRGPVPTAEDAQAVAEGAMRELFAPWRHGDLEYRPLHEGWLGNPDFKGQIVRVEDAREENGVLEFFVVWAGEKYYSWIPSDQARVMCTQQLIDWYEASLRKYLESHPSE